MACCFDKENTECIKIPLLYNCIRCQIRLIATDVQFEAINQEGCSGAEGQEGEDSGNHR
jgi:hypothetical protein